ncbi:MAG: hypothetical protein Q9226_005812 [Calogaya cf. arnoldii]
MQAFEETRADRQFSPPKKYTNAILRPHDITALIRDTEPHERVLFRSSPAVNDGGPRRNAVHGSKRQSQYLSNNIDLHRPPRPRSVVTTLLGAELGEQIRSGGAQIGKERGKVGIDVLLKGAEKLCAFYPMPGAREKISLLRSRFDQLTATVTRYEARVTTQAALLAKRNRRGDTNDDREENALGEPADLELNDARANEMSFTAEDLEREEQEIRELEKKKRALEDRVSNMARDLGGLLR